MNNQYPWHYAYLTHGGGPLPLLDDPSHHPMIEHFAKLRDEWNSAPKPAGILVISAHWEVKQGIAITSHAAPPMLYDYYGFPEASYQFSYPAPGDPAMASILAKGLKGVGWQVTLDEERGFDHGVFIPLMLLFPKADIPIVTLSLNQSLDPSYHWRLGQALAKLLPSDWLVIGSGASFHNMRLFFKPPEPALTQQAEAFADWLDHSLGANDVSDEERGQRLVEWLQAPAARFSHPREEHLLPLHVVAGLSGRAISRRLGYSLLNYPARCYFW